MGVSVACHLADGLDGDGDHGRLVEVGARRSQPIQLPVAQLAPQLRARLDQRLLGDGEAAGASPRCITCCR